MTIDDSDHEAIAELLAAYAIDAVDGDEARMIEEHLSGCPRCSAEVEDHREMAGLLANSGGEAPANLWDRIADQLTRPDRSIAPPAPVLAFPDAETRTVRRRTGRENRPWMSRARIGAAAAAAVVIATLGVQVGHLDQRVGQLQAAGEHQALAQAALNAMTDPQATKVTLTAFHSSGPGVAELVLLPSGTSFVVDSRLPKLPADRTYQLWGSVGGALVSLGLLGTDPEDVPFRVDPAVSLAGFAVTVERAGGVVRSTQQPVAISPSLET